IASDLVAQSFVAASHSLQNAGQPLAIRVVETRNQRRCPYPPESCSQKILWTSDRPATPRRLALPQLNLPPSSHCRAFLQCLELAARLTKGQRARWYRWPFSSFLSFFIAQAPDPGIYLRHAGKSGQCAHIFYKWIFRRACGADGRSVIFNYKFH